MGPRAAQQSPIRDVAARGRTLEFESGSAQGKSLRFELRRDGDRLRGTATGEIAEDRVRVEIVAARMSESADASPDALSQTLLALDEAMFDAFNKCADPAELAKHAAFFDKDVEFYHDGSGLTVGVDAVIAQTRQNVCGKFQRKLDRESFRAYPIPGYGAMTVGTHRFCHAPPICEGVADFAMVWRELDGVWKITRTLSYGHRASAAPAKAAASRAQ